MPPGSIRTEHVFAIALKSVRRRLAKDRAPVHSERQLGGQRQPLKTALCTLRHFPRHFFGSFVIRRAPPCADDARRKAFLQSRLSGTEGLFAEQDGTSAEMTLD